MKRIALTTLALAALAACSQEPAGGRGPFDPVYDAPPRVYSPVVTPAPLSAEAGQDPSSDAALRAQVEAALARTGEAGAPSAVETEVVTAAGTAGSVAGSVGTGVDPNAQEINLSLTPRDIQKLQREEAARRLEEARQQRVEIAPEGVRSTNPSANVVRFAQQTTHAVGTRVYRRDPLMSRTQSASVCARFENADAAQRSFLEQGGPQEDRFNLDPDGDGFACRFDPTAYRQLTF